MTSIASERVNRGQQYEVDIRAAWAASPLLSKLGRRVSVVCPRNGLDKVRIVVHTEEDEQRGSVVVKRASILP